MKSGSSVSEPFFPCSPRVRNTTVPIGLLAHKPYISHPCTARGSFQPSWGRCSRTDPSCTQRSHQAPLRPLRLTAPHTTHSTQHNTQQKTQIRVQVRHNLLNSANITRPDAAAQATGEERRRSRRAIGLAHDIWKNTRGFVLMLSAERSCCDTTRPTMGGRCGCKAPS